MAMMDTNYAPVCGIYCGECSFLGQQCKGCGYIDGKPFWTSHMPTSICPLHDCCRNQKELEHCGLCADFPCEVFFELRDPNMSDEEFEKSLEDRKTAIKRRTVIGTSKWLSERAASQSSNAPDFE